MARRSEDKSSSDSERIALLEALLARERAANTALRDVAQALGSLNDLDRLLELVLSKSAWLVHAERATLFLLDDEGVALESRHVVGERVQKIRLAVGQGIAGSVVKTGKSIRVEDAYSDKRFNRSWDAVTGYRTRAILASPMKNHQGKTIGVLQVLNKAGGQAFTKDDEALLNSLATQAAISIDNARLFISVMHKNAQLKQAHDQLEQKIAVFKLLFDLERGMSRASTEQELIGVVLAQTIRATETRVGAILLRNEQRSDFSLYVLREAGKKGPTRSFVKRIGGLIGRCMNEVSPLLVEHLDEEDDITTSDTTVVGCDVDSGIAVPLEGEEGAILGAIAFYDRVDENPFSNDDLELLRLVAANVSTAVSLRHVRESREATERLSTIGRLLSSVLHDLKTPMTVISGYVQLLATTRDPKQRQEFSELVMKQFEHITTMQKEVLAFARGERSLFLSRIYLYKFFEELEQNVRRELEERSIKFVLNLEDRGTARFDEGKMTRALHNLVRNASDAIGEGPGTVTLDVKREKDDLVISVSDTGPGIPKEIEGKLFQSFVTAGKKGGTGLGLAIVKKVVEEHGGQVSVASSKKGAIFTMRLPQSPLPPPRT